MSQIPPNPFDDRVIRITHDDANSQHVDDMLKRQASLRGETGITRDRKARWYYSNWFIFMLAGTLAALGAWAIIEPIMDDMLYLQGPLQAVVFEEVKGVEAFNHMLNEPCVVPVRGWIEVNGQKAWITQDATVMTEDGQRRPLTEQSLTVGRPVGIYTDDNTRTETDAPFVIYVLPQPPADPPAKASLSVREQLSRNNAISTIFFALVAALVGMAIGMADGIVCRAPRRIFLAGGVGLLVGFLGGFVSNFIAGLVYLPLYKAASSFHGDTAGGLSTTGFLIQIGGRGLTWCLAGMAMGLAQGISLRSVRLLAYGFLGGVIGGLAGGLLFDPVYFLLVGEHAPSAHLSRLVGLVAIGAAVGAMIGVVELLARDAWLRMVQGPLAGKEFVIFKDIMHLGSSPRAEIYLFNDPEVAPQHATIRAVGDNYEIECESHTLINGVPTGRARLHHGDQIEIGRTIFTFQKRRG